jgi:two-component system KDP operon response regulator KdpE
VGVKQARILVVDDEPRLLRFVRTELESDGYRITTVSDGQAALKTLESEDIDLVILDIMLPGMDGFEICRRIREFSPVPVVMLTAKGGEDDKVRGLELGADDYLTKPFGQRELLARVKAVLRRSKLPEASKTPATFTAGDLHIDFAQRKVTVRGREIKLSPTEYKLLYQLAINAGRVLLHEDLLRKVWGPQYRDEAEYLWVYIGHLRRKIELDPNHPQFIQTKPGFGYVLETPVAPDAG